MLRGMGREGVVRSCIIVSLRDECMFLMRFSLCLRYGSLHKGAANMPPESLSELGQMGR